MLYKCIRCGVEFEANHKTAVCKDCHIAVCCVCGKEFELTYPYDQKTCSPKCRGIYRKESGIAKRSSAKAKQTVKMRYGVDNIGSIERVFTKTCAYCGKEFQTTSNRQIYCGDDYGPCPVCGKPSKIVEMYATVPTCSPECKQAKTAQTCLKKYGATTSVNSNYCKELARKTSLEKYGVDKYSKTEEFKEKFKQTSLDRYGTENPMQSQVIKDKTVATNMSKYEKPHPMMTPQIHDKAMQTCINHYGGIGMSSSIIRSKIEATNIKKYGVRIPSMNEEIKAKQRETCLAKYHSSNWLSSYQRYATTIKDTTKVDNYLKFKTDPARFIDESFDHVPSCKEICEITGVTDTPVYNILINSNNRELATFHSSTMEIQIQQFLKDVIPESEVVKNCRYIISPYELDFYLPEYNIAIECNPTATHNSSFTDPWGVECKPYNYHKMKSVMCRDKDVFLFHIFGYEWEARRDVILSMLRNLLGKNERKIYGRNTRVEHVMYEEGRKFLDENHKQGATSYSIGLGLYYQDELVSLMCFNKMRSGSGRSKSDTSDTYELSRFCNKINTTVVGSASKLFKYYVNHFEFDKIVSFSDVAHTRGTLYETLGFSKIIESTPSYVWVDLCSDHYLSRVSCMKSNISKTLHDDNIDMNLTEREIMESHGYARVYDSGTIRWEYHCTPQLS